jgi:hypothetical protein
MYYATGAFTNMNRSACVAFISGQYVACKRNTVQHYEINIHLGKEHNIQTLPFVTLIY